MFQEVCQVWMSNSNVLSQKSWKKRLPNWSQRDYNVWGFVQPHMFLQWYSHWQGLTESFYNYIVLVSGLQWDLLVPPSLSNWRIVIYKIPIKSQKYCLLQSICKNFKDTCFYFWYHHFLISAASYIMRFLKPYFKKVERLEVTRIQLMMSHLNCWVILIIKRFYFCL